MNWLKKIIQSSCQQIKKASLRGEWFLDDSGQSAFTDGDIGEYNHETYALSTKIPDELYDKYEKGQLTKKERYAIGEDFLQYMEHGGEAREWMVEKEGWIRVHGNNFELQKLNETSLSNIADFIYEELMNEEEIEQEEIYIDELDSGRTYSFVMADIIKALNSGQVHNLLALRRGPQYRYKEDKKYIAEQNRTMEEGLSLIDKIKMWLGTERYNNFVVPLVRDKTPVDQLLTLRHIDRLLPQMPGKNNQEIMLILEKVNK